MLTPSPLPRLGTEADDSEIEWIMNGKNSTMLLYDFNGTVYEPRGRHGYCLGDTMCVT